MAGSPPKPPPPNFAVGASSPKPPPGISIGRHPSDEELMDYLRDRVASGTQTQAPKFIHEADLYSADPDLLTTNHAAAATSSNGERAWYFFTPLHPKGSTKTQMKRHVDTGKKGTWVSLGKNPKEVLSNGQLIGHRRSFAFEEKVGGMLLKSAWRMMELRLKPNEGGQEAGSSDLLALCKVYVYPIRAIPNAKAEGESSMAAANEDAEAPGASAAVTPGREGEGADEEIAAETEAGPVLKKRKAGDKNSGAETAASSPERQNKADGEIESADAATTADGGPS